jgi:hypothetical protein
MLERIRAKLNLGTCPETPRENKRATGTEKRATRVAGITTRRVGEVAPKAKGARV